MSVTESGSYGKMYVFSPDIPEDEAKDVLWDMAARAIGEYFRQGVQSVGKVKVIYGNICDDPGFLSEDGDELGCGPRPHRHCGWKAVVVV